MTVPSVSLELHRAVVAQHDRSASDILATNAALAERVQALEAALDAKTDEAATANERAEKWKAAAIALDSAAWKAMDWAEGTRVYNASVEVEALNLQEATLKPALARTAQSEVNA